MASFLIKDVRIFDGETTTESGCVLVEHGKISRVSNEAIEYDGKVISKPGHTLLPGLIDVHVHCDNANPIALPQALRFGCTTLCDMHNEFPNIQKLREQVKGGDCADIKTTSYAATIDGGWPEAITRAEIATWPKLRTTQQGHQYVLDRLAENVDYIKLMHESGLVMGANFPKPPPSLQKSIIETAHAHNLLVVAHATCLSDTLEILSAGADGLTHTFIDAPPTEEVIAAYKKNNAHCNPTLAAMGSGTKEGKETQERFARDERVQHLLGETEREQMCKCMEFARKAGATCENAFESVRKLKEAGVLILCGSDSAGPAVGTAWGLSMHQELDLFVNQCGFTPEEALISATSAPAKRFKFSDRGMIKPGLRADLLLVEGNPLEEISHTLNLRGVWAEGKLCSAYEGKL
ncbi:aryldialkylphosphatase [Cercospora zeina]